MTDYIFTCPFCNGIGCDKCNETGKEPDRYETTFRGRKIIVMRGPLGHWCGYAEVSSEDLANEIYANEMGFEETNIDHIDVHGGITFGGIIDGKPFVGFDCAHLGDAVPSAGLRGGVYRDMQFALREAMLLACQLDEIDKKFKREKEK